MIRHFQQRHLLTVNIHIGEKYIQLIIRVILTSEANQVVGQEKEVGLNVCSVEEPDDASHLFSTRQASIMQ